MDDRIPDDEPEAPREFYIPATTSLAELEPRTLKHGDSFAVFDRYGGILRSERSPQGLFHRDTRYLSRLELRIDGKRPLLLSSTVDDENVVMSVDLTKSQCLREPSTPPAARQHPSAAQQVPLAGQQL
jgi:glycogen debranching enzyme